MPAYLAVRSWERFQHYKDRDPPWVKLYRDLFTTESWVLGTDVSRLVQVASILLAARYSNRIPYVWNLVRKVACFDFSEQEFHQAINHLALAGFLEIQDVADNEASPVQPASNVLATCSTEAEAEGEAEKSRALARPTTPEAEAETPPAGKSRKTATRIPDDFELTDERRAVAEAEQLPADRTFAKFVDYWRAASGSKARKHDWDATWRNWCRSERDRTGNVARGTHQQKPNRFEESTERLRQWVEGGTG